MAPELVLRWAEESDVVYAADSGGDRLIDQGLMPNKIVGDLDSAKSIDRLEKLAANRALDLVRDMSVDQTDCDKLLDLAYKEGHDEITLVSVEGDQLDHVLAVLQSAARSPLRVRIALRSGIGWVLSSSDEIDIPTRPGRRVSVVPLTPTEGVSLRGVHWPLERSTMNPLGLTSISNVAVEETVHAHVQEGAVFLFVEYSPDEVPFW